MSDIKRVKGILIALQLTILGSAVAALRAEAAAAPVVVVCADRYYDGSSCVYMPGWECVHEPNGAYINKQCVVE